MTSSIMVHIIIHRVVLEIIPSTLFLKFTEINTSYPIYTHKLHLNDYKIKLREN